MKYFSPDSIHLNEKNFSSLFSYISEGGHQLVRHSSLNHLISIYGNYSSLPAEIAECYRIYSQYDFQDICAAEVSGVLLIDVCWLEFLSYLYSDTKISDIGVVLTRGDIFEFIKNEPKHYRQFVANIASAAFWVEYWNAYFEKSSGFDAALIFSGSLTYARSLIEILRKTSIRVFLLESFFTGNDYYCEERFLPLPNESFIKHKNYYDSVELNELDYDFDRVKALNKIILSRNLNVKQPPFGGSDVGDGFVLVVGQVVNDFSVLGYGEAGVSTLALYSQIIEKILASTSLNVVFKSHPWENSKHNLKSSVTANFIREKFSNFLDDRLYVVEDFNIEELFSKAKSVILFNSQAGIEAAWFGLKPIVLGCPFYGEKGFTKDLSPLFIDEIVDAINQVGCNRQLLTLAEYDKFELFLVKSFIYSLVSKHKSGVSQLRKILAPVRYIKLSEKKDYSDDTFPQNSNNATAVKAAVAVPGAPVGSSTKISDLSGFEKKLIKLIRNPRGFVRDSKNPVLRFFSRFV